MRLHEHALLALVGWLTVASAHGQVQLTDVTVEAGLLYEQWNCDDCDDATLEPYNMTGGACVADFDGDGWVDLFATRTWFSDLLFLNRGDGTFAEDGLARGVAFDGPSNGAACADVNDDGAIDIYVTTVDGERSYLYVNDGTGFFAEQAVGRGVDQPEQPPVFFLRSGMSASFGDYDLDGWLDLHTSEWDAIESSFTRLYRNLGGGFFVERTHQAGVHMAGVWAFTSKFGDLDGDGYPELLQAADFDTSRLYRNNRDGSFTDVTDAARVGTDENGMGAALGDYDNDGDLDWFISSIFDPQETCQANPCGWQYSGNRLYANDGDGRFTDVTSEAGVRRGWWGWGATFLDIDNDGDLDLAHTNGFDLPQTDIDALFELDPNLLWLNDGNGGMTEVALASGFADRLSGKGILTFDYDMDGDLDLFVIYNNAQAVLYRNDTSPTLPWLKVGLEGVATNHFGVGARIQVQAHDGGTVQTREVSASSNFLAQNEIVEHFGLGEGATSIHSVQVSWPLTGYSQQLRDVEPTQLLTVRETDGTGDAEADLDVDLDDLVGFVDCLSGPDTAFVERPCGTFDLDLDGDVDTRDYGGFQRGFTGPDADRTGGRASDSTLTLDVTAGGRTAVVATAGSTVTYEVRGRLNGDDQGLALVSFDLAYDGGALGPVDAPTTEPMTAFDRDAGLTNPAGFGGTPVPGGLRQVGGGQNTVGNDGAAGRPSFPVGTVLTGVAHATQLLARGTLTVPATVGRYELSIGSAAANVIAADETGENGFWQAETATVELAPPLSIQVVAAIPGGPVSN